MARNHFPSNGDYRDWPRRPPLSAAATLYFVAMVGQVLLGMTGRLLAQAFPGLSGQGFSSFLSAAFQLGFLLLPVAWYCRGRPGMARGLRLKRCPPLALFLCALAAVAGVFLADTLGTLWLIALEALGAKPQWAANAGGGASAVLGALVTALLPAVCEETMFRGALLSAWERRGAKRALCLSAMMFASLHASVVGLPVHLTMGLALGAVVMGADCLYGGMVFHLVYNGLMLILGVGGNPTGQSMLQKVGGMGGVWLTLGQGLLYGGVMAGLIRALWVYCQDERDDPPPMDQDVEPGTVIVLASGVVTALCLYLIDALTIWGVL